MIYSEFVWVVMPGTEHPEKGRLSLGAHLPESAPGEVHLARDTLLGVPSLARDTLLGVLSLARDALLGVLSLACGTTRTTRATTDWHD